jgi:ribosomal protein S18 acetylase RimI-like enzyme
MAAATWEADAMTDVTVRPLGEEDWQEFRAIRLAALRDSPDAFAASAEDEEAFDEDFWRLRLRRSTRLVAVQTGEDGSTRRPVGVVSLGQGKDEEGRVAEIFGLWVAPDARGTGVATKLVEASAERARRDGRTHVSYWVGTDNGRAVAFASGIGFRPTDFRRPMRVTAHEGEDDEEEIAMILPLGDDRVRPDVL